MDLREPNWNDMNTICKRHQGVRDALWTNARRYETFIHLSGGLGVVGSNPATPTRNQALS